MIALDLADLVVIAGRTLELDEQTVLSRLDLAAATAALAEAADAAIRAEESARTGSGGRQPDPAAAAVAGLALVRALAVHRPFPYDGTRVAAAGGLQFLSVNGWRAQLDPPQTAAVVIEALANGQLSLSVAADWLAPRLSPTRRAVTMRGVVTGSSSTRRFALPARPAAARRARPGRRWAGTLVAAGIAGLALLTTACAGSMGTAAPGPGPGPTHHAVVQVTSTGK